MQNEQRLAAAIQAVIEEHHESLVRYRGGFIRQPVTVTHEILALITRSRTWSEQVCVCSRGAYDNENCRFHDPIYNPRPAEGRSLRARP